MNRIDGERIAREAAVLLRGDSPRGDLFEPALLADLLCHHHLGALASWQASRHETWRRKLGPGPLERLDSTVLPARIRRRMVVIALADALEVLRDTRPLLFKGLALAELYPEPFLRDPGDLDIVVSPGRFLDAASALETAGWRLLPSLHRDHPEAISDLYGFALVFRHPVRPVILDLHRAPIDRTEPFWISPEALYERTTRLRLQEGIAVSTLAPEVHLALAALHSVRHGTFRFPWFLDLHYACNAWRESLDRDYFEQFCRAWGILRAVRVAFGVSQTLFDTSWHPLQHLPEDRLVSRAAARRSPFVVARGHLTRPGSWRRLSALLDLVERPPERFRYVRHTLFPPRLLFASQDNTAPGWGRYLAGRLRAGAGLLKKKRPKRNSASHT